MSSTAITTITGLAEVQEMLDKAPALIVLQAFQQALTAASRPIARELYARTPEREDENTRPEDQIPLREDVQVDITLDSRLRGGELKVGFGKQGHVANWIQNGHRIVTHKPGHKVVGFVPPNPFMTAAAEASASDAIDAFQEALVEALQEVF